MAEKFEMGEVVQLKSGGTSMTVEEIDGEYVWCVWFEGKKVQREKFASGALKKYSPRKVTIRTL